LQRRIGSPSLPLICRSSRRRNPGVLDLAHVRTLLERPTAAGRARRLLYVVEAAESHDLGEPLPDQYRCCLMIEMTPTALFPQPRVPFRTLSAGSQEPAGDALALPRVIIDSRCARGIARLVAAEQNYAEAFGAQWRHYPHDSAGLLYENEAVRSSACAPAASERNRGVSWHKPRSAAADPRRRAGRAGGPVHPRVLLRCCRLPVVTSTDLSSAVEPNQVNCPAIRTSSHHFSAI